MSYKTDRLARLFPQAYATTDTESLLYKLLDAIGAELMDADEAVKRLLKSHWVNYASGAALDGLGAIYGVSRRQLRDGTLETDDAFRLRLKSVVPLFTGGGTVKAIKGAVRSALGLPFDLAQLNLPAKFKDLQQDIEDLIVVEEFSPDVQRVIFDSVATVANASEIIVAIDIPAVQAQRPVVQWTFNTGGGRQLSMELIGMGTGVKADASLIIGAGQTLTFSADDNGHLIAVLAAQDMTSFFTNLDGSTPAILPAVPTQHSEWKFRAQSGLFDISTFDGADTFDLPLFRVEMRWVRYQPLTFDVHVPYFLQNAVADLKARYGYTGELFVFQGLPIELISHIVDQTRAAGVRSNVHFSLNFLENHDQRESLARLGIHHIAEEAAATEMLVVGSVERSLEAHDIREAFAIGGVFDISPFDGSHGFT
jgi:hypothetical protein